MQGQDKKCVFCKIITGDIPSYRVWEDQDFLVFLDVRPINDGHCLIVPRIHIDYVFDLPEFIYQKLFAISKQIAPAIQKVTECKRVGVAIEGFGVPHCHLHLVPLYKSNELDPNLAHIVSSESLENMQARIKAHLANEG